MKAIGWVGFINMPWSVLQPGFFSSIVSGPYSPLTPCLVLRFVFCERDAETFVQGCLCMDIPHSNGQTIMCLGLAWDHKYLGLHAK